MTTASTPTLDLARKLISQQFPEYDDLPIIDVEKQGHDNRTYRLGDDMLIRLPTEECYALAVEKEQKFLPLIAKHITTKIPVPIKLGQPSNDFPFHFSIYNWIDGTSLNHATLNENELEDLAYDLAKFLKELQKVDIIDGPSPGQHNWFRGDHISVYDEGAREQIAKLADIIDTDKALTLWNKALSTKWDKQSVWVHGDFAVGNILLKDNRLEAIIDFGCLGVGDPACDLVIAWTLFKEKSREIFITKMNMDENTWLRAKAWGNTVHLTKGISIKLLE